MKNTILLLILTQMMVSCSLFENRSHYSEMVEQEEPFFVPGRDFDTTVGDSGREYRSMEEIKKRTPAYAKDNWEATESAHLTRELLFLENRQDGQQWRHYVKYKEKLATTSEKIYFLKLNSISHRNQYLYSKGITDSGLTTQYHTKYENKMAARNADIILGMSMDDVTNSWGRPTRRDVAGNPMHKNERWSYNRNGQRKHIYFESGRVGGWTNE